MSFKKEEVLYPQQPQLNRAHSDEGLLSVIEPCSPKGTKRQREENTFDVTLSPPVTPVKANDTKKLNPKRNLFQVQPASNLDSKIKRASSMPNLNSDQSQKVQLKSRANTSKILKLSFGLGNFSGLSNMPSSPQKLSLPTLDDRQYNYILPSTLIELLSGKQKVKYFVLDCRSNYEYDGGHIEGALHIQQPEELVERFFIKPIPNVVLIFHCEYSQLRAPARYNQFRKVDRQINSYPNLSYPEIYLLKGGYQTFYKEFQEFCKPRGYVPEKCVPCNFKIESK